ncbi:MAG: class I SAM-dependent methyltransferase [Acidobacteriota bacterium]|nr:MAG: class I SAM-dependent methyltransferase [Acidobacteriota bacterium]
MLDPTQRFSDRVDDYVKYRPSYPVGAIEAIIREAGLSAVSTIADIGCGTGISSRPFLERGIRVIGIEPNDAMRAAAKEYLAGFDNFSTTAAAAEKTGLSNDSVDAVIAAQAFHWFDQAKTLKEFRRILRPGGSIVLMWNERLLDATEFLREYEGLLLRYATDYSEIRHDKFGPDAVGKFFDAPFELFEFKNIQSLDLEGVIGRVRSSSYMPAADSPVYGELIDSLQALFAKHAENDRIEIFYDTRVYISRL